MIEEILLQYGALGAIVVALLYMLQNFNQKFERRALALAEVISNNTIAMTRMYEITKKCKR